MNDETDKVFDDLVQVRVDHKRCLHDYAKLQEDIETLRARCEMLNRRRLELVAQLKEML